MKKYKILLFIVGAALLASISIPFIAEATPASIDRITDHIEPLVKTDYIKGDHFVATSTSATSTLQKTSTTALSIGSLSGILKAVGGYITTGLVNLASDITGTLPVANGGTASTTLSGILKGNGTSQVKTAIANTDYQIPVSLTTTGTSGAATFNGTTLNVPQYSGTTYTAGTGLTLTTGAFSVNTSQNIATLSNLTGNGLVKTSGGIGTLGIATAGTDYVNGSGTSGNCVQWGASNSLADTGLPCGSGGGSGGSISTSTALVAGNVDFSTGASTIGNDSNFVWNATTHKLGVGSTTPSHSVAITGDLYVGQDGLPTTSMGTVFNTYTTDLSSNVIINSFQAVGAAPSSGNIQALQFNVSDTGAANVSTLTGINGLATKSGSGTITTQTAIQGSARLSGTVSATSLFGFNSQLRVQTGSSATKAVNYNVAAATVSGTITGAYGVEIAAQKISGVSTGYGIAQDGTSDLNYFLGLTGFASSTPTYPLSVNTGATGASIDSSGVLRLNALASGLVKSTSGLIGSAANGTDYTLITANTCSAAQHVSSITAAGVITCSADSGGAYTATYPITLAGSAFGLAFGTTTSNIWGGAQTFSSPIVDGTLSGVISGNSGTTYATATSTPTLASEFTYGGTLGSFIGGASGALSLTTNGTALSKLVQVSGNTLLGNNTGSTGNVVAFATSTLGIALSDTIGTLAANRGGTGATTLTGLVKGNGTSAFTTASNGTDYTLTTAQTCTNQVITALTAAGGSTCATVSNAMLANSTISGVALGGTLNSFTAGSDFTGTSYNGSATVSNWAINMATGHSWTGLQQFANASSTLESIFKTAYFGGTATTTINADGLGSIIVPSTGSITLTGISAPAGKFAAFDPNGKIIATTTPSGGSSVGGSDKQVQFNDGGSTLAGAASLIWDKLHSFLGIASSTPGSYVSVNASTTAYSLADFETATSSLQVSSTIYTSGQTWTKPAGLDHIVVFAIGGGAGASVGCNTGPSRGCGTGVSGGSGAASSFTYNSGGNTITAGGGTGGHSNSSGDADGAGGTGGTASGGDTNTTGGAGGAKTGTNPSENGGVGGNTPSITIAGITQGGQTGAPASSGHGIAYGSGASGGTGGANGNFAGGGGGSGAISGKTLTASQLGTTETIVVGGGGGGSGTSGGGPTNGSNASGSTGGVGGGSESTGGAGGNGGANGSDGVGAGAGNNSWSTGGGGAGGAVIVYTYINTVSTATTTAFKIGYVVGGSSTSGFSTSTPAIGVGTSTLSATISVESYWGDIIEMFGAVINGVHYIAQEIDQFGHFFTGGPAPTAASCTGFSTSSGADDRTGTITFTSGSSCSFNFANTWSKIPVCTIVPETSLTTIKAVPSTTQLVITFGTAQSQFGYICQAHQ